MSSHLPEPLSMTLGHTDARAKSCSAPETHLISGRSILI